MNAYLQQAGNIHNSMCEMRGTDGVWDLNEVGRNSNTGVSMYIEPNMPVINKKNPLANKTVTLADLESFDSL